MFLGLNYKNFASDPGFGFNKSTDGTKLGYSPSLACVKSNLDLQNAPDLLALNENNVFRLSNGKIMEVGESILYNASSGGYSFRPNRFTYDDFHVLVISGIDRVLFDKEKEAALPRPLRLAIGLPAGQFFSFREDITAGLKGVLEWETWNPVEKRFLARAIDVQHVEPLLQSSACIYNQALDFNGKIQNREIVNGLVGAIDIGMYTTDCTILNHLGLLPSREVHDSLPMGNHTILEKIQDYLGREFKYFPKIHEIDEATRRGYIKLDGNTIDLKPMRDEAVDVMSEEIVKFISSHFGEQLRRLDAILLSGGPSPWFFKPLKSQFPVLVQGGQAAFPSSMVIPHGINKSAFDNVLGFYKYLVAVKPGEE